MNESTKNNPLNVIFTCFVFGFILGLLSAGILYTQYHRDEILAWEMPPEVPGFNLTKIITGEVFFHSIEKLYVKFITDLTRIVASLSVPLQMVSEPFDHALYFLVMLLVCGGLLAGSVIYIVWESKRHSNQYLKKEV